MDEKQILLVKVSWGFLYKQPDLVEEIFIKKLRDVCPQIETNKKAMVFKGIAGLINTLVLNIHCFQNTYEVLDLFVKVLENEGCDKSSFEKMVQAFLSTIEKIHGSNLDLETKSSWGVVISVLSFRYAERLKSINHK